jgi:hypothetical protein
MTRKTNARLAGFMFLFYIAAGIASMILFAQASRGEGTVARLAAIAQNATTVRATVLLTLLTFVAAAVLGVTLYALTRDEDRDLALFAAFCRLTEGTLGAAAAISTLKLLTVAAVAAGPPGPEVAAAQAYGGMLLQRDGGSFLVSATCFAIGSTIFSYLFLRARSIPVSLAWLGVFSSVLLVLVLPLQLMGFLTGAISNYVWIPMALFEVTFAFWLLVKGVAAPRLETRA